MVDNDVRLENDTLHCAFFCADFTLDPKIEGLETPLLFGKESPQVSCSVNYFRTENIIFLWTLNKQRTPGIIRACVQHPNNSATFRSDIQYNFTQQDDSENLTCSVSTTRNVSASRSTSATISYLPCKWNHAWYDNIWRYSSVMSAKCFNIRIFCITFG